MAQKKHLGCNDSAEICEEGGKGLIFPLVPNEHLWPRELRTFVYFLFLVWCFLGVAIVSDIFMEAIERVTSKRKRKFNTATRKFVTVRVWNPTVANLTLMALGSSAPEILLSIIELLGNQVFAGELGPSTIVGSAAFNLFIISAVCVMAIPTGQVRYIKETNVYIVTAIFSIMAYVWLIVILDWISPNVVEIWEAVITFVFFPVLVFIAYAADIGWIGSSEPVKMGRGAVITADMTAEELKDLEADIRKRHGQNISREQVAQIMEIECAEPASKATYRLTRKHHPKKHPSGVKPPTTDPSKIVPICEDDEVAHNGANGTSHEERCVFNFVFMSVACMETCGKVEVIVTRSGLLQFPASVSYRTKDGTATSGEDFKPTEGKLTFNPDEVEKSFEVEIVDDDRCEDQEEFYIELFEPQVHKGKDSHPGALGDLHMTTIKIIDKDIPGILCFDHENDQIEVQGKTDSDVKFDVLVKRVDGASGQVSCKYRCEGDSAQVNEDFLAEEGTLVFTPGECEKKIEMTVRGRKRYEQTQMFRVILEEPEGGAKFDESTDGGDETCILTVFIKTDVVIRDPIDKMRSTLAVRWGKAKTGNANWGRQFKDAVFDVYGDDDDLDEDEERTVGQKAYAWSFHVIQLPWKIVFAFIPPTDYCGGWVCFCFSLIFIGLVTAIIGDVAAIFGCCLGIKAMGTAITFVALGTSLPDTFASKTAAQQDPHADASVGNVTGSNSVNVFLGLGMPWTIGAIYWAAGANDEWRRKFGPGTEPHLKIPEAFREGAFIVQAGDLAFSVTVFSICAVLCVAILAARRRLFGGELGGPLPAKIVSAVLMISLWLVYIGMSFWKMETS